ncbi:MAG: chorismate mutase [Armatimonadetes bacterium]|nr:chorismate mutase [Armatimonadota bacterium]
MMIRGIRGAIKVRANYKEDIKDAAQTLIRKMLKLNEVNLEDIASIFFTTTKDINFEFPAIAVREMGEGWELVPCLCSTEIDVPGSMDKVLRALVQINTDKKLNEIKHVYLGETAILRPDIEVKN